MSYNESNNDFLSYEGRINRKNYVINMFILVFLYIGLFLINFNSFSEYIRFKILYTILIYTVELLRFVIIIAILSIIYRRISDFSSFSAGMKKVFVILYIFPFIYLNWGHYLLNFLPGLIYVLDLITLFILMPFAIISSIIFAFLKSKS